MLLSYGLRNDQWDAIKDLFPGLAGTADGTARDNRLFVDAVLCRYRAGIARRDLPDCFGAWGNFNKRLSHWAQSGVWQVFLAHLADEADNKFAMIDSTIVRTLQHSAGAIKKRTAPRSTRQSMRW